MGEGGGVPKWPIFGEWGYRWGYKVGLHFSKSGVTKVGFLGGGFIEGGNTTFLR